MININGIYIYIFNSIETEMSSKSVIKPFSLIVAMHLPTRGIGFEGQIPWKIPGDQKFFQYITTMRDIVNVMKKPQAKNAIIMGRLTWKSIGSKPLPNRLNVIVSQTENYEGINTRTFKSLKDALENLSLDEEVDEIIVIGGSRMYEEAMTYEECNTLYITELSSIKVDPDNLINFDVKFPPIPSDYEKEVTGPSLTCNDDYFYRFNILKRKITNVCTDRNVIVNSN